MARLLHFEAPPWLLRVNQANPRSSPELIEGDKARGRDCGRIFEWAVRSAVGFRIQEGHQILQRASQQLPHDRTTNAAGLGKGVQRLPEEYAGTAVNPIAEELYPLQAILNSFNFIKKQWINPQQEFEWPYNRAFCDNATH